MRYCFRSNCLAKLNIREIKHRVLWQTTNVSLQLILFTFLRIVKNKSIRKIENNSHVHDKRYTTHFHEEKADDRSGIFAVHGKTNVTLNLSIVILSRRLPLLEFTNSLCNFFPTECGLVCHVKCAPNLPRTCGLPSQFMEHFSETLQEQKNDENADKVNSQSTTRLGGKREGWLRVPRYDVTLRSNCL